MSKSAFACSLAITACLATTPTAYADTLGGQATPAINDSLQLLPINDEIHVPWGIAELPAGELLVTDRGGELYLLDTQGEKHKIQGLPRVHSQGQGGLLDVVAHPNFSEEPWVYFSYSKPIKRKRQTAIARAKLTGNTLTDWSDLYIGNKPTTSGQHYGSRIVLTDGYLFFTIGDRGNRDRNPQDLARDGGKVYRLHDDGRIPEDNPFVDTDNALPATWSYGHRNPQGLSYDEKSSRLWLHEHGPRGGDELNLIEPGNNYGWPLATFGINYSGSTITQHQSLPGMTQPVWHWTPSIAPSGMAVVNKEQYPSLGDGLLVGSLKFGELHFRPTGDKESFSVVTDGLQRVRSLSTTADGTIYIGISNAGVFKLKDSAASQ